jgi:transcription initiation factor TFIIIB Brf1 subunit/transcription initiation factor TFIIB
MKTVKVRFKIMFCPNCGSKDVKLERWEVCPECGCIFKILNTPAQQKRGY